VRRVLGSSSLEDPQPPQKGDARPPQRRKKPPCSKKPGQTKKEIVARCPKKKSGLGRKEGSRDPERKKCVQHCAQGAQAEKRALRAASQQKRGELKTAYAKPRSRH